jgi:hypothetical protein
MHTQKFTVKLLENIIISERAATIGGHRSLDYLPGATLLGACASSLYKKISKTDAYTVFYSGKVRFGNALPLSDTNRLSYPMPLCWHEQKTGTKAIQRKKLLPKNVLNYQIEQYPDGVQPVQLRTGYIALDGSVVQPETKFEMKTAIDSNTGRANNGQLFGYSSIPKEINFEFYIEADEDEDVPAELFQRVINNISGNLALGRSRSAEYGNVKITPTTWTEDYISTQQIENKKEITIWLLADLALLDKFGQPNLLPTTQDFGLPNGKLNLKKSFIRSRHYAPFNGHYRRRESERTVLSMGSVLHFDLNEASKIESKQTSIGLYRQAGLGKIWINPPILETAKPKFETSTNSFKKKAPKQPDIPLAKWLQNKNGQNLQTQDIEKEAKRWLLELNRLYHSARLLSATPRGIRIGPSPTQWGRVLELTKTPNISNAAITQQLFIGERAVCKDSDQEWTAEVYFKGTNINHFKQWLQQKIDQNKIADLPALLAQISRQAIDIAREQEKSNNINQI